MNCRAKRLECVQLAGAFERCRVPDSGSKLDALQTLRALRMWLSPAVFITSLRFLSLRFSAFLCVSALNPVWPRAKKTSLAPPGAYARHTRCAVGEPK
jgi:hypothetical protein